MAIEQADNIQTGAPKPTDSRYYNNLIPYLSCSEVNSTVGSGVRYSGLTVNILGTEYWYKDGITDPDLVEKTTGGELNWTGSTANALGTYVDGTHICAEPNLTFDGDVLGFAGDGNNKSICVPASTTPSSLIVAAGNSSDGSTSGRLDLKSGDNTSTGYANGVFICGGCSSDFAGAVYVCGGCSTSTVGGSVTIRSGAGSTDGTVNICHGTTLRLNTTTTGVKITGGLQITEPATKSTETNILYIADDGTVASGATSGGASYWSGDTLGISNSGHTCVGIGIEAQSGIRLAVYNAGNHVVKLMNCVNSSYSPTSLGPVNLYLNNKYDGATTQENSVGIYMLAHGSSTSTSQNYIGMINAVHACCNDHTGFMTFQGRNQSGYAEMLRLCNCSSGVVAYIKGILCQSNNVEFCQGGARTISVAQATDGGAGDQLYICAGGADDIVTATCYVGGGLYLYGGRGSSETAVGSNGGTGGVNKVVGGAGGSSQYCYAGGTGGNAYLCGGSGGLGCCDTGNIGDVCVSGYDANLCGTHNVCVRGLGITDIRGAYVRICGNTDVKLYDATTLVLNTLSTGVCVTGCGFATDWVASSDCRLKKCIEPISNALSMVNELCGVCYDFCEDNTPDMGLIAQDVEKILPRLVSHNEPSDIEREKYCINDEILGLKYDKLSGLFVEAIKDLTEQNKCLQNQIISLRDEMREINE